MASIAVTQTDILRTETLLALLAMQSKQIADEVTAHQIPKAPREDTISSLWISSRLRPIDSALNE